MTSEGGRRDPPSILVVSPRGLAVMVAAVVVVWTFVGGETVSCEGSSKGWHCERHSDSLFGRTMEVALGADELSGPNKETETETVHRRGYHAAMIHAGGSEFRLAEQPSQEIADADRRAWLGWAREPVGKWTRSGPVQARYRNMALIFTALTGFAAAASAWVRLRPE